VLVVGGQLPLSSGAEPSGQVVVSVCCLVGNENADGGGIAFEGGGGRGVEGGCADPTDCGGLPKPVLLEGEVFLQSILFPLASYSHV
jgi:hypothetical protein